VRDSSLTTCEFFQTKKEFAPKKAYAVSFRHNAGAGLVGWLLFRDHEMPLSLNCHARKRYASRHHNAKPGPTAIRRA
jgi:hypothetical protein